MLNTKKNPLLIVAKGMKYDIMPTLQKRFANENLCPRSLLREQAKISLCHSPEKTGFTPSSLHENNRTAWKRFRLRRDIFKFKMRQNYCEPRTSNTGGTVRPNPQTPEEWQKLLDQNARNYINKYQSDFSKERNDPVRLASLRKAYRAGWSSRHALSSKIERGEM